MVLIRMINCWFVAPRLACMMFRNWIGG